MYLNIHSPYLRLTVCSVTPKKDLEALIPFTTNEKFRCLLFFDQDF